MSLIEKERPPGRTKRRFIKLFKADDAALVLDEQRGDSSRPRYKARVGSGQNRTCGRHIPIRGAQARLLASASPVIVSPMLFVRPSQVHGNGVFADSDIASGGLIGRFSVAPLGRGENVLAHAPDARSRLMRYRGEWFIPGQEAFWLNHAEPAQANATWVYDPVAKELELIARCQIQTGEEVLIDYGCGGLGIPPTFRVNPLRS